MYHQSTIYLSDWRKKIGGIWIIYSLRNWNKLSVKRNLSLLQSDIHWNLLHQIQNDSYLDTDWVNLSLISTSKKIKFTSMKVEINAMKSQEVNMKKSQKMLASRARSSKQTIARITVYATRHWNWMNSYWMFWILVGHVRGALSELARRAVSAIFEKMTFRDLTAFSPFCCEKILCFSDILIKVY